jgi:DNA-binding NarL/FixJ family response regulator
MARPLVLAIVEMGGYPNFTPLYQRAGFDVVVETRMRKAMNAIKKLQPRLIVAEFNFQSDFRDRTSSLESMLSVVERCPHTRVIVFYDREYAHQFQRLLAVRDFYRSFTFPIAEDELFDAVRALLDETPAAGR